MGVLISRIVGNNWLNIKDDFGAVGDGTTDDTAAFTAAIAALTARGGGVLWVPVGTYKITSTLTLPANTHLQGEGWASVLAIVTNGLADMRRLKVSDNCIVSNIKLSETGVSSRTGVYGVLMAYNADNVVFENVEIDGSSSTGIFGLNATKVQVRGCYVHNCYADGIHIQRASQDWLVRDCVVWDVDDDCIAGNSHGRDSYDPVKNITIIDNHVGNHKGLTNNQSSGIVLNGVRGGKIADNSIENTQGPGVTVNMLNEGGVKCVGGHITISNNVIVNTGQGAATPSGHGILVAYQRDINIEGNTIKNVGGTSMHGIELVSSLIGISVKNNHIQRVSGTGIYCVPVNSTDANVLDLWGDANLTDGRSKAYVFGHDIHIEGNVVSRAGITGIGVSGQPGQNIENLEVCRNTVIQANTTNAGTAYGVHVQYVTNVEVSYNTVKDNANALTGTVTTANLTGGTVVGNLP